MKKPIQLIKPQDLLETRRAATLPPKPMEPILITAPNNRIAMRYAYIHHLAPAGRTLLEAEQVYGYERPVTVICLVGDRSGTFNITPHMREMAEKLFILEKMHYVNLLYTWFDTLPTLSLEDAKRFIQNAVPEIKSIDFKPPQATLDLSLPLDQMTDFGVVVVGYGKGRAFIFPMSQGAWGVENADEPQYRFTYTLVAGIVQECRKRFGQFTT